MSGDTPEVVVRGRRIPVPAPFDPETFRKAAEEVNAALLRIEGESPRIDSVGFALRAALQFAAERLILQQEQETDTRQLLKSLDGILSALRSAVQGLEEDE